MEGKRADQDPQSGKALNYLVKLCGIGLAIIVLYGFRASGFGHFFVVVSLGLVIAGAAVLIGGVLGFLFGIPRTLQQESGGGGDDGDDAATFSYRANTNLEQISDWLTKMLVGVGLTQLTSIPDYLGRLAAFLAGGLGGAASDAVFALSLFLFFSVIGFLFGYLWTRLNLAGAFRQADLMAIGALASKVDRTSHQLDEFKKQSELDVEALNVAYRQLNPGRDIEAVTQEELDRAIAAASYNVRVQIFNQAWSVRGDNWRTDKARMALTIPIFRALIKADPEDKYHMNHGQLGFALKDQAEPDWKGAEAALDKAIQIRGPWRETGRWLFYEFNRALCRIHLDPAFAAERASDPELRKLIVDDLTAAYQSDLRKLVTSDETVKQWMALNKVRTTELKDKP